ncbi:TOM1-like protein 6 [Humulus lupulus]|uniref:TOM1-like protein 6 n=1 Tax=Humulus lupulus TaxID=3486 RepID=UPI002B4098B4|nr:TOM1-like protein 6 [Humulus lupulus]
MLLVRFWLPQCRKVRGMNVAGSIPKELWTLTFLNYLNLGYNFLTGSLSPPTSHQTMGRPQPGYGLPSNASRRLDETMATEIESLSLSSMEAMQNVLELLRDMLQAVNPGDSAAVKDEVIVELAILFRLMHV